MAELYTKHGFDLTLAKKIFVQWDTDFNGWYFDVPNKPRLRLAQLDCPIVSGCGFGLQFFRSGGITFGNEVENLSGK